MAYILCIFFPAVLLAFYLYEPVNGHGYMLEPPGRSSAWRVGIDNPKNYNDNGLNCGGSAKQHDVNEGRCGVCGDDYALDVKPNEPGPGNEFAKGKIVATYFEGQFVKVTSVLTAFHEGYFEMKLCENDVPQVGLNSVIAINQECLDVNLLRTSTGRTKIEAIPGTSTFTVKLPEDITCEACVLQWRYRAGNNWGSELVDGEWKSGAGYGDQEEFINCADIRIIPKGKSSTDASKTLSTFAGTTETSTISTTGTPRSTTVSPHSVKCYGLLDIFDTWCEDNCALKHCPPETCWCDNYPSLPKKKDCVDSVENVRDFCDHNCNFTPPYCPTPLCSCEDAYFDPRK